MIPLIFVSLLLSNAQDHDHSHHHGHSETEVSPSELRDPHEHANGYTSHNNPYHSMDAMGHTHSTPHAYWAVVMDRLEMRGQKNEKASSLYDVESWVGTSFEKLVLTSEGTIEDEKLAESKNEIFWSHAIFSSWDLLFGARYDAGLDPGEGYASIGISGVTPYWLESSANLYVSDRGRLALNVEIDYEILFTQRFKLVPRIEVDWKKVSRDEDAGEANAGLRLRYEIYRRLYPYIGMEWETVWGEENKENTRGVGGVSFWF